ncbi:MAG: M15 family metallopeptidase [Deltaproteobacteria bacterium]|nr:M15 family metallopeptidase [Deltaproteobacteria bacterium]
MKRQAKVRSREIIAARITLTTATIVMITAALGLAPDDRRGWTARAAIAKPAGGPEASATSNSKRATRDSKRATRDSKRATRDSKRARRDSKHGKSEPLVDVGSLDARFILDIRYATTDNFFNQKVYDAPRCILLTSVAERMLTAQQWLDRHHPGLRLMFKDCYRPNHVQFVMWKAVEGTAKARYVANPHTKTGSIHSYGAAVDLTLADREGQELDMGTPYDFLGRLAEPRHEAGYLADGKLTAAQVEHRRILRRAMVEGGGMHTIPNEWWHFNAAPAKVIRARYPRLDVAFSSVPTKVPETTAR